MNNDRKQQILDQITFQVMDDEAPSKEYRARAYVVIKPDETERELEAFITENGNKIGYYGRRVSDFELVGEDLLGFTVEYADTFGEKENVSD